MRRFWLAIYGLAILFASPAGAWGQFENRGVTPENRLWGYWQSLDGKLALFINDDKSAILEIAGAKPGDPLVPSFGSIQLMGGVWALKVTDPARTPSTYGIALVEPRRMHLTFGKDGLVEFAKCDYPFEQLDKNGDGFLIPEETGGTRLFRLFADYDRNNDKQLSRAEFARYWTSYWR